ncbi:MAG: VOC family protein [Ginsengibacter sp.]
MEKENENPINPVVWFEIYVDDIARARTFYEKVLDIKMGNMADPNNSDIQMYSFPMHMDKPNASGALVKMEGFKPGGNGTIVYFDCRDCSTEDSRVAESGGKILQGKTQIGEHGFISLCIDTEGNTFGLHSMR